MIGVEEIGVEGTSAKPVSSQSFENHAKYAGVRVSTVALAAVCVYVCMYVCVCVCVFVL